MMPTTRRSPTRKRRLTVEDELKQKDFAAPLMEVYTAQSAVQTTLTTLIEAYSTETERLGA